MSAFIYPEIKPEWLPEILRSTGSSPSTCLLSRGAPPKIYSEHHRKLLPEVQVIGGEMHFAHDAGMIAGSPEWYVAGARVKGDHAAVLRALLACRGSIPNAEAAQVVLDFYRAWELSAALDSKPSCWDASPVLGRFAFSPPSVEVITIPQKDGVGELNIARVHFWCHSLHETYNPHPTGRILGPRGMDMGPAPPPPPTEYWASYVPRFVDVLISDSTSAKKPGCVLAGKIETSIVPKTIYTTRDGMSAFTPSRNPSDLLISCEEEEED